MRCDMCLYQDTETCEECTEVQDDSCRCHIAPPCAFCEGNAFEEK